ncbi:hypothetical protein ACVIGA_006170 [Bradyrhizobium sp. USDA 3240]
MKRIEMMRSVLEEAARELSVSVATQTKMAQTIVMRAAAGDTRAELKSAALETGKTPAA